MKILTKEPTEFPAKEIVDDGFLQDVGKSCPTSVKVQITPPNAYHHFTLPEEINPCTGKRHYKQVLSNRSDRTNHYLFTTTGSFMN